jgi:lipopolysaccharide/colanic/teichoic acid biosynthesis glycosyltransferase
MEYKIYQIIKRLFDIILSSISIICFLPFFIPITILLKCTGEGFVFYFQDRIGYKNRKFRIWKFATMLKASPALGSGSITLQNDWRLTPLGGFLRKTKINEIPQIINVLLGDMSIVGPRPQMEIDFLKYPKEMQLKINDVRPGLSSIAAIVFRDEERYFADNTRDPHEFYKTHISPYKGALEVWYQEHLSFKTDFLIIFLTCWVIFFKKSRLIFKLFKNLPKMPQELE